MYLDTQMTRQPIARTYAADSAWATYGRDLMTLPGVTRTSYDADHPDEIRINFANEGFRALADNVLRDAVDGVRLVLNVKDGGDTTSQPWSNDEMMQTSAVRAMDGVLSSYVYREVGRYHLVFRTDAAETSSRIRRLINDRIDDKVVEFTPYGPLAR